ncbi:uncharacterized protein MONBRDRAFT_7725 [Monosiga brevicollis MX1]|uniref:Uncharacterized protein n=1 Tax=Monosiga brevicollis TaxID=81824 RepID=A9UY45_MONBE|nr:uncharacterized protein MONBRDRAFT_7725 [Monosiga brevicollis MX1]EDQ89956.1 predicted protein [Monosiga brevicollis MX1]|eukprot:XP_001745378.1 hypothetical protein [Monosiga brevicollis MX1]
MMAATRAWSPLTFRGGLGRRTVLRFILWGALAVAVLGPLPASGKQKQPPPTTPSARTAQPVVTSDALALLESRAPDNVRKMLQSNTAAISRDKLEARLLEELREEADAAAASRPPATSLSSSSVSHERIIYVTSIGGIYHTSRHEEILAALRTNLESPWVEKLIMLTDKGWAATLRPTQRKLPKLKIEVFHEQPTYKDLFTSANAAAHPGQLIMVANSDIELSNLTFVCLDKSQFNKPLMYVLTRHPHPSCPKESGGGANPQLPKNLCTDKFGGAFLSTADAFLTSAPVPQDVLDLIDHVQNRLGAENRLVHFFRSQGRYRILDPCFDMPVYHRHCSQERAKSAQLGSGRIDGHARSTWARHRLPNCSIVDL